MTEKEEVTTEATEEQQTEAPAEAPSEPSEVSQPQSICSVCGKLVIPIPLETPSGTRYKCPKCNKFMKPLLPEDVKAKEVADAKIAPLEIEMTNRVKELLKKQLPRVYGIPAKHAGPRITAIIDTLTPGIATNPYNLHSHIKRYATGADDRHLESIIAAIFAELETDGYKPGSSHYVPAYGQQQGYPGTRGGVCSYPPAYPPTYPYPPQQGYPAGYPQQPPRQKPVKIIVDGQELQTDLAGHMAWKNYQANQKKEKAEAEERKNDEKRRQDMHDLEKRKFQEEIKKIAGEGGGKTAETLVEVKVGEQTLKVPASIAPLYLNKGERPEIKALKDQVAGLTTKLDDQREENRKKETAELKTSIATLSKKMDNQPTFFDQMDAMDSYAVKRGYTKTGKTTLDVLSEMGEKVDNRAQQLLKRMPGGTEEFQADVHRTPEERREKAKGIQKRLEKKEDVLSAEDALVRAASKMG